MKTIKAGLLLAITGLILFITPCFAMAEAPETIISYINLNDNAYYDVEIMLHKDGKISLPFKQLSEIFEVTVKTDHATKEITFTTSEGKSGKVGNSFIYFGDKKLSSKKNFYLQKGLMEDIKDEIFCDENDLSEIFGAKLKTDKNDMSISAKTGRNLKLLQNEEEEEGDLTAKPKYKAYTNVSTPQKNNKVSFQSVSLNNSMMNDTVSQYMLNQSQKSIFFNNNTQAILRGKAFDGDFSVDMNTYNYKGEFFSFGGLGFNYHNKIRGLDYEIGRVRGFKEENTSIATQLFGAQISNYETRKKSYRDINGTVAKDSLVKLYIDGKEYETLSTYDGYYSLSNIYLDKNPVSVKLEELKADGTTQVVFEKTYPKYANMPAAQEKKYSILTGISGYNNKLFNQNGYIYEMNTKKFVVGAEYEYGIKENLKLNSKLLTDRIVFQPTNSIWQNIYSADALLTSGTWKNPNSLDGITNLNTFEYIKNDNLRYKASLGASTSRDLSLGQVQRPGYTLNAGAAYKKDFYDLKAEAFTVSPDFYLAGSDGGFMSDRTGASFALSATGKSESISGTYKRYYSNTAGRVDGGLIEFNEYILGVNKTFGEFCDARFNLNGRDGSNTFAKNSSYYYDLNFSKRIGQSLQLQAGKTESNYQTTYNDNVVGNYNSQSGFKSLFSTVYAKMDYRMPKNLGNLAMGHDAITYDYGMSANEYSMMKIGYTFPEFKRITVSLGTGYKYTGSDKGLDFSANIAYRTKSGRTINFNYQFNRNGGYIINNMYMPMSARHSVNLVLNDAFAVLPSGLKSVGYDDKTKGFVEAVAYIDKNKNGIYDKDDVGIEDVPIRFSWVNDPVYTKSNGKAIPFGTDEGVYYVKIETDKLPATLLQEKGVSNEKIVRIDRRLTTKVEFPLKSCVGNVSGKLKIQDDFERKLCIRDFIVTLNDENGNEAAYTTVNEDGTFYLSGIEPGKYTVQLDKSFIDQNNLMDIEGKSIINVEIPCEYKDFVDIAGLDLEYRAISI